MGLGENALVNHVIIVSKTVIRRRTGLCLENVIQKLWRDKRSEQLAALIGSDGSMQRANDKWVHLREETPTTD